MQSFAEPELYSILEMSQHSTQAEIKEAYRRLALIRHPDKSTDPEATEHFQRLRFRATLSDAALC
jgi:curved DNA-binding protein CbpA